MKIYIKDNYLFIDDGTTLHEGLAKDVLVRRYSSTSEDFLFNNVNGFSNTDKVNIVDIKKGNGDAYDLQEFVDFYTLETGKPSASLTGAELSYYLSKPASDQTITSAPALTTLLFSEGVNFFGDNIINDGGGLYTLLANNTYKLSCELAVGGDGGEYSESFSFYDVTNSAFLGTEGLVRDFTGDSCQHSSNPTAIVTPITDIQVKLCIASVGDNNLDALKKESSLVIEQKSISSEVPLGRFKGNTSLRFVSSFESGEDDLVIPQDTPTLIPINNSPFKSFNSEGKITFDLASNLVDVSNINENSLAFARITFLGVSGDADLTPSVRLYNDKNDLNTYLTVHGQGSKLKTTKTTSYLVNFWLEGEEAIQLFVETDKNETIGIVSITVEVFDVN